MKNQLLDKLARLRNKIEAENRKPNASERAQADTWLEQLDDIEHRDFFAEDKRSGGYPTDHMPDDPDVSRSGSRQRRGPFKSDGEFYQAVMRAGMPNGQTDRRLFKPMEKRAATGLSEAVPSDGGFLVDSEMAYDLAMNLWNNNEVLKRVNKVTLTGNKNSLKVNYIDETSRADGYRSGGILGYWLAEAGEKLASKPKFRQNELDLNKLIGLCYSTDELLEDGPLLAQTINEGFKAEFDFLITNAIINGTGAGMPLGIINAGCMVSVAKESGQAADTIVYQNVNKMWARLIPGSHQNSIWICNPDCLPMIYEMSLAIGTGGSAVFMPQGGASQAPYSTLFGRPLIPIEQCQTVGTTGDIILCDFSKYLAIDKGGMQGDVSIHVRFIYDESVFRFVYRFDGQPVLASAITPKNSANELSHFVKLDSR